MEVSVQRASGEDKVSVKHRWCWGTLFRGRLTRLMRFKVCVSHGSTFDPNTTFTVDDLGANAAAEAGSNCGGILRSQCDKLNLIVL